MSDLDEIVDIQITLSDVAPSASSGGGDDGGGTPPPGDGNLQVNLPTTGILQDDLTTGILSTNN